jgi:hypothetical protein
LIVWAAWSSAETGMAGLRASTPNNTPLVAKPARRERRSDGRPEGVVGAAGDVAEVREERAITRVLVGSGR